MLAVIESLNLGLVQKFHMLCKLGRHMRKIAVFFVIFFSITSWSDESPDDLVGTWVYYERNIVRSDDCIVVEIGRDMSGYFSVDYGGSRRMIEIHGDAVVAHDGFYEINISDYEKLLISSWKTPSGVNGKMSMQYLLFHKRGGLANFNYAVLKLSEHAC